MKNWEAIIKENKIKEITHNQKKIVFQIKIKPADQFLGQKEVRKVALV